MSEIIKDDLIDLNFRPGIHDEDINYNFRLLQKWIEEERLQLGGYGIVEGFELTKNLPKFEIIISSGQLVNKTGKKIHMAKHVVQVGPPVYQKYRETIIVDNTGIIKLKFPIYSDAIHAQILYSLPEHRIKPLRDEFRIINTETKQNIPYISIVENLVMVSADLAGTKVDVEYLYSNDRIDAIFAAQDGSHYLYQKGIISTGPSSPDIDKYKDKYFLLGFAYWHIGTTVDVELLGLNRAYRPILVDKQNILYLNGEPYKKSKFIYFVEPKNPELNDIWYDKVSNVLYIWKNNNGVMGWFPINDQTDSPIKNEFLFTTENNPEDLQTFLFGEHQTDMLFMPRTNALDIYIDNAPLMQDQFTEIIKKGRHSYEDVGIGFKLNDPLDRATPVQVAVYRTVKSTPQRETFQRMAMFSSENYQLYNGNSKNLFITFIEESNTHMFYEIGEEQLEVWVNGKRLRRNIDFFEALISGDKATAKDKGTLSDRFLISKNVELHLGDSIQHRIIRHMWSYENLQKVIDKLTDAAEYAKKAVGILPVGANSLQDEIDNISYNSEKRFKDLEDSVENLVKKEIKPDDFIKKEDKITEDNLPDEIKNKLFKKAFYQGPFTVKPVLTLKDCKTTDYFNVFYIDKDGKLSILIHDIDYKLMPSDENVILALSNTISQKNAHVYVTGINF